MILNTDEYLLRITSYSLSSLISLLRPYPHKGLLYCAVRYSLHSADATRRQKANNQDHDPPNGELFSPKGSTNDIQLSRASNQWSCGLLTLSVGGGGVFRRSRARWKCTRTTFVMFPVKMVVVYCCFSIFFWKGRQN